MATPNSEYSDLIVSLKKAGISDTPYQWFAFVLGLVSRGFDPGDRPLMQACRDILNDGEPLPGAIVATLTSKALKCRELLDGSGSPFCFPDNTSNRKARLTALQDLAYALSLGLAMDPQTGQSQKVSDADLLDGLRTLSEIARVDPDESLDEQDLSDVLDYMAALVRSEYQKHRQA